MPTAADSLYCSTPSSNPFSDAIRTAWCGAATLLGQGGDNVVGALDSVGGTAEGVAETAGGTAASVAGDVTEAANPLNLLGLGLGVSFGGVVAVVGIGLLTGIAADQLLAGGAGLRGATAWASSSSKRR